MTRTSRALKPVARTAANIVIAATFTVLVQAASAETVAFTGARIIPVSAAPIESGTLVVRDGKIAAVGAPPVPCAYHAVQEPWTLAAR